MLNQPILSVEGIEKIYPNGTIALKNASFSVADGTIHGLIGANGAGKSTLIKILSGAIPASNGRIVWRGETRAWRSPADAAANGIATIHQHIPLAPTLSVRENVFLASPHGWRNSRSERDSFGRLLNSIGYTVDPDAVVDDLPVGQRQMVCILQALASEARLLIMDEPTASLSEHERSVVFDAIRRLRDTHGTSVLFISHFLDEIMELCQHVTVLRDGVVVLDQPREQIDERKLVVAIVGKEASLSVARSAISRGTGPVLEVHGLSSPNRIDGVEFAVEPGEIVGLAGLFGSGRSEILHAIYGADHRASGTVKVDGRPVGRNITAALQAGIVIVPEDRIRQALFVNESIRWNTSLSNSATVCAMGVFPVARKENRRAAEIISTFSVVAKDPDVTIGHLSGGNAQKIALARAVTADWRVILLDEPTAGVDIGAKADIHRAVAALAAAGAAVVVAISDFEELLSVCDRILIVSSGRVIAERRPADTTEHELTALAGGLAA
jgi:ribose transport system ATP-binding protein